LTEHYGDTRNLKTVLTTNLNTVPAMKKMEYHTCIKLAAILDDFEFRAERL